jgi:hypothetical protein
MQVRESLRKTYHVSATTVRSYPSVLKIVRTIADLSSTENILTPTWRMRCSIVERWMYNIKYER